MFSKRWEVIKELRAKFGSGLESMEEEQNRLVEEGVIPARGEIPKMVDKPTMPLPPPVLRNKQKTTTLSPPEVPSMSSEDVGIEIDEDDVNFDGTEEFNGVEAYEKGDEQDDGELVEDFGTTDEDALIEEIAEESGDVSEIPSDQDVVMQMKKDSSDERLAGLADDVEIDEDEDSDGEEDDNKKDEWDGDHANLLIFVTDKMGKIPQHKGSLLGCQRARFFLDNLMSVLSKGIRTDLKGAVNEDQAEDIRVKLLDGMAALDKRINYLSNKKVAEEDDGEIIKKAISDKCEKCGSLLWNAGDKKECLVCGGKEDVPGLNKNSEVNADMKKEATVKVNLVASPFIHGIASLLINSKVSAGHDIEKVFEKLAKKYDLNDRERFEIVHLLSQMGFSLFLDRGRLGEGNYDQTDGEGIDWMKNYYA